MKPRRFLSAMNTCGITDPISATGFADMGSDALACFGDFGRGSGRRGGNVWGALLSAMQKLLASCENLFCRSFYLCFLLSGENHSEIGIPAL